MSFSESGWITRVLLVAVAVASVVITSGRAEPVSAQITTSHTFYGTVTVGGSPAPVGTEIQARIDGVNYAFSTQASPVPKTDSNGKYGATTVFQERAGESSMSIPACAAARKVFSLGQRP